MGSLLLWAKGSGRAEHGGVRVDLTEPPTALADGLEEVVFIPGVVNIIRCGADPLRHMTQEEVDLASKMLVQMENDARDAMVGGVTLAVVFGK